MKTLPISPLLNIRRLTVAAALGIILGTTGLAQDTIKATSVIHADGSQTDTKFDPVEKTGETAVYDSGKHLMERSVYTLDEKNLPKEGTFFNGKGVAVSRFSFVRDDTGRVLEERRLTPDGKLTQRLVYRYDGSGKKVGVDAFDGNGTLLSSSGSTSTSKKKPAKPSR